MNMLTKYEDRGGKSVRTPIWSMSSNSRQMGRRLSVKYSVGTTKCKIERIISPLNLIESSLGIDYAQYPFEIQEILSHGEREFLESSSAICNLRNDLASQNSTVRKNWERITEKIYKGKIPRFLRRVLLTHTPRMVDAFADIDAPYDGYFKYLIRMGKEARKKNGSTGYKDTI